MKAYCYRYADKARKGEEVMTDKDKPPLLTGREIYEIGESSNWWQGCSGVPEYICDLLKAQREKDIKFYGEMSNDK